MVGMVDGFAQYVVDVGDTPVVALAQSNTEVDFLGVGTAAVRTAPLVLLGNRGRRAVEKA